MNEPKNIKTLLAKLEDPELPRGYDARFSKKLKNQNESSWLNIFTSFPLPTNVTSVAVLGSFLVVSLSLIKSRNQNEENELAINDEIDMLDDLDVLMEWDGEEKI